MGKQSSRLIYRKKDHKDIYFQEKYHRAMYLGNRLLWKKLYKIIPYISFDGDDRSMCIKLLFVNEKITIKKLNLNGEEFSDFNLVRGDNTIGYFLKDTSWVFSKNGQIFLRTPRMTSSRFSSRLGYTLTKKCFLGVAMDQSGLDHRIYSRDINSYENNGSGSFWKFGELISGYLNPKLDIFVEKTQAEGYDRYVVCDAKNLNNRLHSFDYFYETKFLGVSNNTVYVFVRDWSAVSNKKSQVQGYNYIDNTDGISYSEIKKDFYFSIMQTFYKNEKFIVYCLEENSIQGLIEKKLQIYETTNFLSFVKVETPQSITVKDMDSDEEYTISFDSTIDGDVYLQPYCTLDNTYYFDEDGVMHDDDGCLIVRNINETGFKKIVIVYFDNFYFRQSDNNFCQILIYEEEDVEGPLLQ